MWHQGRAINILRFNHPILTCIGNNQIRICLPRDKEIKYHIPVLNYASIVDKEKRGFSSSLHPVDFKVPKHYNLISDIIEKWAKEEENKTALWLSDGKRQEKLSYAELFSLSRQLSGGLCSPSYPKCALVILPKITEWWIINLAASWCGMIISPATVMLTQQDIQLRIKKSNADCIICTADIARNIDNNVLNNLRRIYTGESSICLDKKGWERFEDLISNDMNLTSMQPHNSLSEDICQLFFTSGTTGSPKMVPHTQASYGIGHNVTGKLWLDLKKNDIIWNLSDTGWAKAAWSSIYAPFITGATAYVHQMTRFDPLEVLHSLEKDEVSVLCAPPTAYRALVQCDLSKFSAKALRHCVSAGEPLNPEVMDEWKKYTGLDIYEGFGQSETTLLCGTFPGMKIKPGSMGRAAPGYDIKILDEDYKELGVNEEGHFAVNLRNGWPTGLFKGYQGVEALNNKVFVNDYYLTGDKAYMDEDSYFWFVARGDDVINSSGYRIGPFEVESALLEHKAVAESAVIGSADAFRGEVVKAFVVLTEPYKSIQDQESLIRELQNHVKNVTAPYKYPRKIQFVDTLPKTISGKIKRAELRKKEVEVFK